MKIQQQPAGQERFEHQPVVRRRLFEVDPVLRGLIEHFAGDDLPAKSQPALSFACRPKKRANEHQPDAVAEIVVAVEVAPFDIGLHELAVQIQGADELAAELRRGTRVGATHVVEGPDPADGPERDVHGASPVHAVSVGVPRHPILCLVDEFARVPLIARQPVGLAESREVLTATELPRHLDVRRAIELLIVDVRRELERPFATGLEVGVPRQAGTEIGEPRTEQVELMTKHPVRGGHDHGRSVRKSGQKQRRPSAATRGGHKERCLRLSLPPCIDGVAAGGFHDRATGHDPRKDARPGPTQADRSHLQHAFEQILRRPFRYATRACEQCVKIHGSMPRPRRRRDPPGPGLAAARRLSSL